MKKIFRRLKNIWEMSNYRPPSSGKAKTIQFDEELQREDFVEKKLAKIGKVEEDSGFEKEED